MVCPGNPPRGHTPAPAPDRASLCDRLVHVATSPSGNGANLTSQTTGATVVLGCVFKPTRRALFGPGSRLHTEEDNQSPQICLGSGVIVGRPPVIRSDVESRTERQ